MNPQATDHVDLEVDDRRPWRCFREDVPPSQILFFCQITVIFLLVIMSIVNIILGVEPVNLWVSLLSTSVGYIIPAPHFQPSPMDG